jgi:hypothetical protein
MGDGVCFGVLVCVLVALVCLLVDLIRHDDKWTW